MSISTTQERIDYLEYICNDLQDTTSLNEKRDIVNSIVPECKDDFNYILEILATNILSAILMTRAEYCLQDIVRQI